MRKAPQFWYRPSGSPTPFLERALTPLSRLYQLGFTCHQHSKTPQNFNVPIVCAGNINVGGSGKTPTALALMQTIKTHTLARRPFFLTRGFGGSERGPVMVDPARHTAWSVGDEPLILAQYAPTVVSADRAAGARLAIKNGADLIIMDDGLQNPGIKKDIQCIVIDGAMGLGNGKLLPAGPLREMPEKRFRQADFFVLIGDDSRDIKTSIPVEKPILEAKFEVDATRHKAPTYIAFAGLGYPKKFFDFLKKDLQLNVIETLSYADHHPYTRNDIKNLKQLSYSKNAQLITTLKDYVRLPEQIDGLEVVRPNLALQDEDRLIALLKTLLLRPRS